MLRNLTFAGWSQECLTSTRPRMCCLLRLFLSRFWWHVFLFLLPFRVSWVHIQTCMTHKLVVDRMQAWNRRCPLLPSLVFLWLTRSDFFCRESLIVSSAPALEFRESLPWWFNLHPLDYCQEIYPVYLLIARAPVMPSHIPLLFPIPKICRTSFLWINHFCHLRPGFVLNGWKSMHILGVDNCVDRFVKLLKERKTNVAFHYWDRHLLPVNYCFCFRSFVEEQYIWRRIDDHLHLFMLR